jgi:hypothetical protein
VLFSEVLVLILSALIVMLSVFGDHWNIKIEFLRSHIDQNLIDPLLHLFFMMKEVLLQLLVLLVLHHLIENELNLHLQVLLKPELCLLIWQQTLQSPIMILINQSLTLLI